MRVGESSAVFAAVALLVGAVWLVYGRSLDAPWVGDDLPSIVENDSIRRLWPLWGDAELPGPLAPERDLPTSGRPLVNASFALNYYFGKLEPRGYRAANICLHALNAILLGALVWHALRLPFFRGEFAGVAGLLAFASALVWAAHPLVTEAVAYATQRTELMVSFFYLGTLLASIRYWETAQLRWLVTAVVACWAGMASKEVMASAPLMVLAFDRTFIAGSFRSAWQRSRSLYAGLFGSWLLLVCLAGPGPHAKSAGFHLGVAAGDWWLTQCKVVLIYLKLAAWPWPLSSYYNPPLLTSFAEAWVYVVPVALLMAAALWLFSRRKSIGYLGVLALAVLAPTMVVPVVTEIAAERRMYLPLAAIVTLFVCGGYAALRQLMSPRRAGLIVASACVLLSAVGAGFSDRRLAVYGDELALWQDALERNPNDVTVLYNLGTIHLERHKPEPAAEYFQRAIALRADYAEAHHNLGAAYSALGLSDEAAREFERAVELEPRYALARVKLGVVALQAGRTADAKKQFLAALQWRPNDAAAHSGLAGVFLQEGRLDDAIRHAQAALDEDPGDAAAHNIIGAVLARQERYADAAGEFEAAVQLDPALVQAQANLMAAYAHLGRTDDAIAAAQRALDAARAGGDELLAAQIEVFLKQYQPPAGTDGGASTDSNR